MNGGPVPAQQDSQAVPEPRPIINDYIHKSPPVDLDMSIESLSTHASDPLTIEPIRTSAAVSGDSIDGSLQSTSEVIVISDDEDPKMDIEIMDLTSDSD
ncbi:hypothetical protein AHAS_Ahas19G0148000 [Arachis hypogaea]